MPAPASKVAWRLLAACAIANSVCQLSPATAQSVASRTDAPPNAQSAERQDSFYCEQRRLGYWFYCERPKTPGQNSPSPAPAASATSQLDAITTTLRELKAKAILEPTPANVTAYKACIAGHPGAATSNQTLLQWLPKCGTVAELWEATADDKTQLRANDNDALVRVAYQCRTDVTWRGDTLSLAGRTLEEAFALENLEWCQHKDRKPLQLRIAKNDEKDLGELAGRIHKRVQSKSFSKTDFALALLAEDPANWVVPEYIADGLRWLEAEIAPPEPNPKPDDEDAEEVTGARADALAAPEPDGEVAA